MNNTDQIIAALEQKEKDLQDSLINVSESLRLMRDLKAKETGVLSKIKKFPTKHKATSSKRLKTNLSRNKEFLRNLFRDQPDTEFGPKEIIDTLSESFEGSSSTIGRQTYKLLSTLAEEGFLLVRKTGTSKGSPVFYRLNESTESEETPQLNRRN